MKSFVFSFLALSFLAVPGGCSGGAPDEDAFEVDITLSTGETSKDSNSVTETLRINGEQVSYTWIYEGYSPSDEFEREQRFDFELSPEQAASLILYLDEKQLTQSLEETQAVQDIGNFVTLDLRITEGGNVHRIQIEGMSGIIENMSTVEAVQDFIYTVKDLGGFYAN